MNAPAVSTSPSRHLTLLHQHSKKIRISIVLRLRCPLFIWSKIDQRNTTQHRTHRLVFVDRSHELRRQLHAYLHAVPQQQRYSLVRLPFVPFARIRTQLFQYVTEVLDLPVTLSVRSDNHAFHHPHSPQPSRHPKRHHIRKRQVNPVPDVLKVIHVLDRRRGHFLVPLGEPQARPRRRQRLAQVQLYGYGGGDFRVEVLAPL